MANTEQLRVARKKRLVILKFIDRIGFCTHRSIVSGLKKTSSYWRKYCKQHPPLYIDERSMRKLLVSLQETGELNIITIHDTQDGKKRHLSAVDITSKGQASLNREGY